MCNHDSPNVHAVINSWIEKGSPELADLDQLSTYVQEEIAQRVSVTKMRKFYESVVKIRSFAADTDRARRLAYKMVVLLQYDMGRESGDSKQGLNRLHALVRGAVQAVEGQQWSAFALQNFLDLMEAMVAFHREVAMQS